MGKDPAVHQGDTVAPARSRVASRNRDEVQPTADGLEGRDREPVDLATRRRRRSHATPFPARQPWLTTVLHQLPDAALIVEAPSAKVVWWNERTTRMWPCFLHPPASLDVVVCGLVRLDGRPYTDREWPLARALATGAVVAEEVQFVAQDGTRTVMNVRCLPICNDRETLSAVVVILHDVSKRRRVEQALQASQARYENLYQDAPDMFASLSVETEHIVQCNETLVRAIGYSRHELLGRPVRDLHHPSCWPGLTTALDQVRQHGRVRDAELQLQCKHGETLDVSLSVAAIRDEQGNLYYRSTWRDITARKQSQAMLDQKQAELERSRLELQALAGRLLTAQEDERRRISRELHDDLNQRLALLTLEIEGLHQHLPRSRRATVERLGTLRDQVVELSDAVHGLAYQLHASILDDLGLPAALESYLVDYTQREAVEIELRQERLTDPLPSDVASCLYRVAQEALRNVARHAGARHVRVSLEQSDGGIRMTVADDGVGFDVPKTERTAVRVSALSGWKNVSDSSRVVFPWRHDLARAPRSTCGFQCRRSTRRTPDAPPGSLGG